VPGLRSFALVQTVDQWQRAAHCDTAIDPDSGQVGLARQRPQLAEPGPARPPLPAGLAFDGACRLYRSVPDEGRVERVGWATAGRIAAPEAASAPLDVFAAPQRPALGEFTAAPPAAPALTEPRGLAVDADDRLFVAEAGARQILVYDLFGRRLLRRVADADAPRRAPLDLAAHGRTVWATVADPPGVLRLEAHQGPAAAALPAPPAPAAAAHPARVAAAPGGALAVLLCGQGTQAWVHLPASGELLAVAGATDLEFADDRRLVVARHPGDAFALFQRTPRGWSAPSPLQAPGYDGLGIVRTPDGRVGFWSAAGFRVALPPRPRYPRVGRVTTYRLDSGAFRTQWGRLFLDACIPAGAGIRVHVATSDEATDENVVARTPPANADELPPLPHPELSPPMPPLPLAPGDGEVTLALHRRDTGPELPWVRPAPDDPFETYEAPVPAAPGRYCWVTLELTGTTRLTPRVRSLRLEHPSHDLLQRLPRAFSRDPAMASFLHRYLAMFDGVLTDLEDRSAARAALLRPASAPEELLPWLAGLLGLTLDLRWSAAARRRLVAEAAWLFRRRGTVAGLRRLLEIYLDGLPVVVVERFRFRGLGGSILGTDSAGPAPSVVGGGFRVGGAVGRPGQGAGAAEDAFQTHAHRFAVLVPAPLTDEQLEVVRHLLDEHRPAYTVAEVCALGAGIGVGRGLHVQLSAMVGPSGGLQTLRAGSTVGRRAVVGRPQPGTHVGAGRAGRDSQVG
jgi:phage tail-like protein